MGKIATTVCNNNNDDDDSSYFSLLPEETVVEIFNKILDLKTLCLCKLVSTKFNLMVNQVNNIRLVASRVDKSKSFFIINRSFYSIDDTEFVWGFPALLRLSKPFYIDRSKRCPPSTFESEPFRSAILSMDMFRRLKSLCIDLPFTGRDGICNFNCSSPDFYKWKVKFGETLESLVFVSPDSVCEYVSSGDEQEEEDQQRHWDDDARKVEFAYRQCLMDAAVRFRMLLGCMLDYPLLEKVSITQSGNRGGVSINGRNKIVEMRERLLSPPDSVEYKLNILTKKLPSQYSVCYVPLLKLPVSGYLMKRVSLVRIQWTTEILDGDDSFYMTPINLDDFADKQEAAYAEAMVEMLKICRRDLPAQPW